MSELVHLVEPGRVPAWTQLGFPCGFPTVDALRTTQQLAEALEFAVDGCAAQCLLARPGERCDCICNGSGEQSTKPTNRRDRDNNPALLRTELTLTPSVSES